MKRILVTGVGGPAGNNFVQCLRMAPEPFYIVGVDVNKYHLEWADLDRAFLAPAGDSEEYLHFLKNLIVREGIDFIHPQPDGEVTRISEWRDELGAATLLPHRDTIRLLQDKLASAQRWATAGLRPLPALAIHTSEDIDRAEKLFEYPYWLRASHGAGGTGSTPVPNRTTVVAWIEYWRARGKDWRFMAEPLLPGRNLACQSLWLDGKLVCAQARERLEYIYPHLAPSGVTGTPIVQVTVDRPDVYDIAVKAVQAADPTATGIFCIDFKEDESGKPVPTEINAGRFFTTSSFFAKAGLNMPYWYVLFGCGENVEIRNLVNPLPRGIYWLRHIDCPARLVREGEWRYQRLEIEMEGKE
ncbi:MAG: hypothetical protein PHC60_04270 [Heliobacteriaceae bacterium]|nr:hypothetical protein [Heliobacteriaceae bacterium]MDD4587594.1 hypothetical protein [Heliobacteriaceae bacterium]